MGMPAAGILALVVLLGGIATLVCICRRKHAQLSSPSAEDGTLSRSARSHRPGEISGHASGLNHVGPRTPTVRTARSTRDDRVAQMLEMGFAFEVALAALESNAWDVNR